MMDTVDPWTPFMCPPKKIKKMFGARRSRLSGAPAHSLDKGAEAVAKKQKRKGEKRAAVLAKGWAVVDKKRQSLKLKQNLGAAPMAAILKFCVRPSASAVFFAFFPREYLQRVLNQRKIDHPGHLVKKKTRNRSGKVNLDISVLKHYLAC